jgi:predicted Zn-dependent protease
MRQAAQSVYMNFPRHFLIGCLIFIFLGSSFSQAVAISIPEEEQMSKEFMEMIRAQRVIIHDPVAMHMINTVGNHILSVLPVQPFDFEFFLVNDDSFNAFASPAAKIFMYKGLLFALDTIDEFAGIMAHEIGHAVSRHVSESIDRSKWVNYGSMAGMLAGILVGATGGGSAASALTIGSMAAGQSAMLAFTRENETEADMKAFLFLKETGYSPAGLLSGLTKMRDSDYRGIEGIPDYFKTHPGTGNRIINLAGILESYVPPKITKKIPDTFDFDMVKYRIMGLYGNPSTSFPKVELKLQDANSDPALNYGIGLLYARKNRRDLAILHFKKALAVKLFEPMILLELGRIYIDDGQLENAISILTGVIDNPIMGLWSRYYLGVAQLESGMMVPAQKNLHHVLDSRPEAFARAYYHLADIMSQEKKQAMSHYYLGIYYSEFSDFKNAIGQLNRAIETLEDLKLKDDAKQRLEHIHALIKKRSNRQ